MTDDPLVKSRREAAIREARRLYPEINPTLAGWVFDYCETVGEEEMQNRIKTGWYGDKKMPVQE